VPGLPPAPEPEFHNQAGTRTFMAKPPTILFRPSVHNRVTGGTRRVFRTRLNGQEYRRGCLVGHPEIAAPSSAIITPDLSATLTPCRPNDPNVGFLTAKHPPRDSNWRPQDRSQSGPLEGLEGAIAPRRPHFLCLRIYMLFTAFKHFDGPSEPGQRIYRRPAGMIRNYR